MTEIRFLDMICFILIAEPTILTPVVKMPLFVKLIESRFYLPCRSSNWCAKNEGKTHECPKVWIDAIEHVHPTIVCSWVANAHIEGVHALFNSHITSTSWSCRVVYRHFLSIFLLLTFYTLNGQSFFFVNLILKPVFLLRKNWIFKRRSLCIWIKSFPSNV